MDTVRQPWSVRSVVSVSGSAATADVIVGRHVGDDARRADHAGLHDPVMAKDLDAARPTSVEITKDPAALMPFVGTIVVRPGS